MDVGFQALAHHADGIANAVLCVDKKFVWQHVQHFAVRRQSDIARGIDGAPHVLALDVAGAGTDADAAAAVDATHVRAGYADHRGLYGNIGHTFRFLHGAANGTYGGVEVDDKALAKAFRFRSAERKKSHSFVIDFRDERGRFHAADVEPHQIFVSLGQACSWSTAISSLKLRRCSSPDSAPPASRTASQWSGHGHCWPATARNF